MKSSASQADRSRDRITLQYPLPGKTKMRLHWNSKLRAGLCDPTIVLLGLLASLVLSIPQEASHAQVEETAETKQDVELQAEVVEGEAKMGLNPLDLQRNKILAAKRFHMSQVFQVEIELIERLCEPTTQQKAKLRVASKGAVKKLIGEWWKKSAWRFGDRARPVEEVVEQDGKQRNEQVNSEDQDAEETMDANEFDNEMVELIVMDLLGNSFTDVPLQEEQIWTNLVDGVLTEEQSRTLAEFKMAQDKQHRATMLQSFVGISTRELGLTVEQSQKLHVMLQPHFENAKIDCYSFHETLLFYYYASKATNEELGTVLSPAQIQKLRLLLLPVREIEHMIQKEN